MCLFLCGGWIPGIKILVFYRNSRQNLLPFPGKKSCVCFCDFIYPCVHILRNILCTETKTSSPNIISYHTTDRKTSPLILFVFMCSYMYIRLCVLPACICMFVYHGNPRQYPDHSRRVPEETGRSRARVPPNLGCHLPHSSTQFPGGRLEDYICKSDLLTRLQIFWCLKILSSYLHVVLVAQCAIVLLSWIQTKCWGICFLQQSPDWIPFVLYRKRGDFWRIDVWILTSAKHAWKKPSRQKPKQQWVFSFHCWFCRFSSCLLYKYLNHSNYSNHWPTAARQQYLILNSQVVTL